MSECIQKYDRAMATPMNFANAPRWRSSDLSRNSKQVFDDAEKRPVIVSRRDGEELVLMSRSAAEDRFRTVDFLAGVVAASEGSESAATLNRRMVDLFPWMGAFSAETLQDCISDLVRAGRAALATGQPRLLDMEVLSWRETADALAQGLEGAPDSLDEPTPVVRPRSG